MNAEDKPRGPWIAGFRIRLVLGMMVVVAAVAIIGLFLAERQQAAEVERELRSEFEGELAALHNVQALRLAAVAERCRVLARRSRIHAALEDGALDLLYPSAGDEMRDVMAMAAAANQAAPELALHAQFYRFLDATGRVIHSVGPAEVGALAPEEEARLALRAAPPVQQLGYLSRNGGGDRGFAEILAMPIISTSTGEVIAALVLGFDPSPWAFTTRHAGLKRGVWSEGRLHLPGLSSAEQAVVSEAVAGGVKSAEQDRRRLTLAGEPQLLFYTRLNAGSMYPAAYEVCVYPLGALAARRQQLRWQVLGIGGLVLLSGLGLSQLMARRLARPVEKLASDSAENVAQRRRAEAALEITSEELQRAARFSADASHQLKTPVTVLRLGLEGLLRREDLPAREADEIAALIHQTYRLSGLIEDLLLLSRMDAGRLQVDLAPVDFAALLAAALDDLEAIPDERELTIETEMPGQLWVAGEKRYLALVLHNLLENARKYNRPGGRIRIRAAADGKVVALTIGNTGAGIPSATRARIFERFHRAGAAENVPGYGLGLNLARELARLHGGDVRLVTTEPDWTEFEVLLRATGAPA